MTTAWHGADKAYMAHHTSCAYCIAAGASSGRKPRCRDGQALWDAYNQAGLPPFMQPRAVSKDASDASHV